MIKKDQIEEMAMSIAECNGTSCDNCALKCKAYITCEILYDKGYRKVPDGAVILTPEERDEKMKEINKTLAECDELQELNIKYYNEAKDLRRQLADIEAENERLSAKLGQILLSIDTVKEMNAMCKIDDHRKQAVKEFGDKIKAKLFSVFGKTICSDLDTQDIADIIDEVLKEV